MILSLDGKIPSRGNFPAKEKKINEKQIKKNYNF